MFGRRFESAHLHKRQKGSAAAEPFAVCGDTSQPQSAALTAPIGAYRPFASLGSGVTAASTFFESLADADDAALMRLNYVAFGATLLFFVTEDLAISVCDIMIDVKF